MTYLYWLASAAFPVAIFVKAVQDFGWKTTLAATGFIVSGVLSYWGLANLLSQ